MTVVVLRWLSVNSYVLQAEFILFISNNCFEYDYIYTKVQWIEMDNRFEFLKYQQILLITSFLFLLQGLAYQLIDDVLDFTGTSASLGKGSLSDIRHVMIFPRSIIKRYRCLL